MWQAIARAITEATNASFVIEEREAVVGGSINRAYKISDGRRTFFVKTNDAALYEMFEAENAGLRALAATNTIRVPQPIASGHDKHASWLILEYLALDGKAMPALLGKRLAALHQHTASQFGWERDNTIGATPQLNTWHDDWVSFWRKCRLGFQLHLAQENGAPPRLLDDGARLLADCEKLFSDYTPMPALLHGDLWSGNAGFMNDGTPVIFDPAVYYGDREADIAMTELFGGFGTNFYAAYNEVFPLNAGYRVRRTFYNLYHILNHYNLFGGGYAQQAQAMTAQALSELK